MRRLEEIKDQYKDFLKKYAEQYYVSDIHPLPVYPTETISYLIARVERLETALKKISDPYPMLGGFIGEQHMVFIAKEALADD